MKYFRDQRRRLQEQLMDRQLQGRVESDRKMEEDHSNMDLDEAQPQQLPDLPSSRPPQAVQQRHRRHRNQRSSRSRNNQRNRHNQFNPATAATIAAAATTDF
jgi:hypothetical protein